ncbi:MAG: hypothetical protein ACRC62_21220 [Microcoleus sp.]
MRDRFWAISQQCERPRSRIQRSIISQQCERLRLLTNFLDCRSLTFTI